VALYDKLESKGFAVLAFPCYQFGNQEYAQDAQIRAFVNKYNVRFPMFAPVDVNGPNAHPLFKFLNPTSTVSWNFDGQWLVDQEGRPVQRYGSRTKAEQIEADVLALLEKS